jgi:hypothetical protein
VQVGRRFGDVVVLADRLQILKLNKRHGDTSKYLVIMFHDIKKNYSANKW